MPGRRGKASRHHQRRATRAAALILIRLAGLTSALGVLISAVNSQARLIFNAGVNGPVRTVCPV
jgi:hypothetical protein